MVFLTPLRSMPVRSRLIAWTQLLEMTGVHPSRVAEVIEIGWINPVRTSPGEYLFRLEDALKLRKLERICRDLDVNVAGASIIIDLTDRIERLENQVAELRRLL